MIERQIYEALAVGLACALAVYVAADALVPEPQPQPDLDVTFDWDMPSGARTSMVTLNWLECWWDEHYPAGTANR